MDVKERKNGFTLRFRASGTNDVPVAVEINPRDGGSIDGVTKLTADASLLESGQATFRRGGNAIRVGPGAAPHRYVAIRGAAPKLPGHSVYITGVTPFDRTLEFDIE